MKLAFIAKHYTMKTDMDNLMKHYIFIAVFFCCIGIILTIIYFKTSQSCKKRYVQGYFFSETQEDGIVVNIDYNTLFKNKTLTIETKNKNIIVYECLVKTKLKIGNILKDGDKTGIFDIKCVDIVYNSGGI